MKEIVIRKNSIWALFYRFMFRSRLPMGLCNLFWMNLFGIILFVPYFILTIPMMIINTISFTKRDYEDDTWLDEWEDGGDTNWFEFIGISILLWGLLFIAGITLGGIYNFFTPGFQKNEMVAFIVLGIFLIAITIWFWKEKIKVYIKEKRHERLLRKAIRYNNSLPEDVRRDDQWNIIYNYENRPTSNWIHITIEAIVGFYKKNCPVITWKNE